MPPVVHRFDPPERFVAGTVGEPGQRTFFLQARTGRPGHQRRAGEAAGADPRRAHRRAPRRAARVGGVAALIPAMTPVDQVDTDPLEQPIVRRSSGPARSRCPGTPPTSGWSSRCSRSSRSGRADRGRRGRPGGPAHRRAGARGAVRGPAHARRSARVFATRAARWSRPGGPRASSAAARSIPRATCARAPTATGAPGAEPWRARRHPSRRHRRSRSRRATSGARPDHARLEPHLPVPARGGVRRRCGRSTSRSRGSDRCGTSPTAPWRQREYAAYLVSEALGWSVVPPTCCARGPHGPGMVQRGGARRRPGAGRPGARGRRAGRLAARARRLRPHDRPVMLVHEDTPALRRMALLRRGGEQHRPQGRARPGDARRAPLRRGPRGVLPRRRQAPHGALGLGRAAASPRGARPVLERLEADLRRPVLGRRARGPCSTAAEVARPTPVRRVPPAARARGASRSRRPGGPRIPWPPF